MPKAASRTPHADARPALLGARWSLLQIRLRPHPPAAIRLECGGGGGQPLVEVPSTAASRNIRTPPELLPPNCFSSHRMAAIGATIM